MSPRAPQQFRQVPWQELFAHYEEALSRGFSHAEPALTVARSIVDEGCGDQIVGHPSLYGLILTTVPVSTSPDWLRVSAVPGGKVRVEHHKFEGPGDDIERPADELLALFWRFVIEKWGIHPERDLRCSKFGPKTSIMPRESPR